MVGDNACKIFGDIGLNKLKSIINCNNLDNYLIGLITLIIIVLLLFSSGYSVSKK
tara:strand:- start:68 stop:232 length:165 start_codon:yes stop_codon:yes gene_type:complete